MSNVREVLLELGYQPKESAKDFRMRPLYRESDNSTVLAVRKDSGRWIDFAAQITGDLADLVKLTLNLMTEDEASKWLKERHIEVAKFQTPKETLKMPKVFDKDILLKLVQDSEYWESRNVSSTTLSKFKGGLAYKGKMAGRYVFPIFNNRDEIIGFAGRDIFNNSERVKWKLLGSKENWVYPAFLNWETIKTKKSVILVESIGDMLALFDAGIENVLVTFGIELQSGLLNFLLKMDVQCIIISFNNDAVEGEKWGNKAANKVHTRLLRHFDSEQVEVALPTKKDFGVMSKEEILEWKNNRKCV